MVEAKTSRWQTRLATVNVRERIEYAFKNSCFNDVEFTVDDGNGNKVVLPASKHILSISSPVFEAMFHGKLAEKGSTIDLPDCTKDGLQEMLLFLHSDVINLTGNNIMEVLYLADKYELPFMEKKCYDYISNDLTPEDVFTVLSQATQSSNSRVEELCWDIVDLRTHQAVTSKAFLNISHDLLKKCLERETLQTDEINIFKAVNAWASNQIEDESKKEDGEAKRAVLGDDVIRLIRFPVLTQEQFADDVLVSDVLCPNEMKEVMQVFSSVTPSQTIFKGVKRKGQWCERWTECRYNTIDSRYCYTLDETYNVIFQVNKPIFLAGIRLFGTQIKKELVITCDLSIYKQDDEDEGLFSETVSFYNKELKKIEDTYLVYSLMVKPPVFLLPNEQYSIETTLTLRERLNMSKYDGYRYECSMYLGGGGKKAINCEDITITFIDSEGKSKSSTAYGQFPSFLLKRKIDLEKQKKTNDQ